MAIDRVGFGQVPAPPDTYDLHYMSNLVRDFNNNFRLLQSQLRETLQPLSRTWVLIQSQTASDSATLDFTFGITDTYDLYMFVLTNVVPATDNVILLGRVSDDGGSTFEATSYQSHETRLVSGTDTYVGTGSNTTSFQVGTNGIGSDTGEGLSGLFYLHGPSSAAQYTKATWHISVDEDTGLAYMSLGAGRWANVGAVDGFRWIMNSGNIESGTIALYGLRK